MTFFLYLTYSYRKYIKEIVFETSFSLYTNNVINRKPRNFALDQTNIHYVEVKNINVI